MKKFWIILLLLTALFPHTTFAYDFMVNGLCYNYNSDGVSVTVTYKRTTNPRYLDLSGYLYLPENITYNGKSYSVTAIGDNAFTQCDLTGVLNIPNSVTSIGDRAFSGCNRLSNVSIPNSVTSIGNWSFSDCSGFTGPLIIPNSVTSIGNGAFSQCSGLTGILTIPESISSIGDYTFGGCSGFTGVLTIPSTITSIGNGAFGGCSGFTGNLSIPSTVTAIGENAFSGCSGFTGTLIIPNTITNIRYGAFSGCSGLTNIDIPNTVTSIGHTAFSACRGLTSIDIPNSVTFIGNSAFAACSSLISIIIPNSVTSIGEEAFINTPWYNNQSDGLVYAGLVAYKYKGNMPVSTTITLNKGTLGVAGGCFRNCSKLASVILPNGLISIGDNAFYGCTSMSSLTIPNSITSIGNEVFYSCNNLMNLTLIGVGAWNYDSSKMLAFSSIIGRIKTLNIGSGITCLNDFEFTPNEVNCYAETPPTCAENTFTSYNGNLHVPASSAVAYMSAPYWQNFGNFNNDITEKITLSQTNVNLVQWDELELDAIIIPSECDLEWSSTNSNVASVDANGNVIALSGGECDIIASMVSNQAVYGICHVTVDFPEITLSLNTDSVEIINIGSQITLTPTITPNNTGLSPTWTSSNETVATVDANGVVTAKGQGECDITATVLDKSVICHVTVSIFITISLDQHEVELDINQIATLTPSCSPVETDLTVTSSDPTVVFARIITQNGTQKVQLVGMKQGLATVTVESVDGKAVPDSCVVTVIRRVGDINADGYINVMDITALIDIIMGSVVPDESEIHYCDLKSDGDINVMDITALIDIIMNN